MVNSCCGKTAVLSTEETVVIFSAISSYLGNNNFRIISVTSPDGQNVYKTEIISKS